MVVDALVSANSYLQIASHIEDPSQYWKVEELSNLYIYQLSITLIIDVHVFYFLLQLDDTIIKTIETAPHQELKEARDLILRIRRRELYQVS